jgi:hypothetical protein
MNIVSHEVPMATPAALLAVPQIALLALTAGSWTEVSRSEGCVFYSGAREGEVQPMRVECDWAVDAKALHGALARQEDIERVFSSVKESHTLPSSDGSVRIYQRHQNAAIDDREVVLKVTTQSIPNGKRYTLSKDADQKELTGEGVEVQAMKSAWEVSSNPNGTTHVAYELRYLPGGSVPSSLVRRFQTSGVQDVLEELRAYAERVSH